MEQGPARTALIDAVLAIVDDPNCIPFPTGHVEKEKQKPFSPEYLEKVKAYFGQLEPTNYYAEFVVHDPETKIKYKANLPNKFANNAVHNENFKSFGYLCRVADWGFDLWNPLPELPLELIPQKPLA